jgi:hypothetical protein
LGFLRLGSRRRDNSGRLAQPAWPGAHACAIEGIVPLAAGCLLLAYVESALAARSRYFSVTPRSALLLASVSTEHESLERKDKGLKSQNYRMHEGKGVDGVKGSPAYRAGIFCDNLVMIA